MKSMDEKLSAREVLLEDVARRNESPIVADGHLECDETSALWVTSNNTFVRFTIGEVKAKREELQLENER